MDVVVERLQGWGRLFYVGAGTSGRLGVLDASECPPTFNTPPTMVQGVMCGGVRALYRATEASEDSPALGRSDLASKRLGARDAVVGVTASGRTPYVLGALRYARARRAATIAVTCNPDSEVVRVAGIIIAPVVGPEVIAGSTRLKAGTAQKLVLNMISTAGMVRLGHVYGNFMVNVHLKNRKLRERGYTILGSLLGLDHNAAVRALRRAGGDLKGSHPDAPAGAGSSRRRATVAPSPRQLDSRAGESHIGTAAETHDETKVIACGQTFLPQVDDS